jgi:hypothetical protein
MMEVFRPVGPASKRQRTAFEVDYSALRSQLKGERNEKIKGLLDRGDRRAEISNGVPGPQFEQFIVHVPRTVSTSSLGLELTEHAKGAEVKKVVSKGVAENSCCFKPGDLLLAVGSKKLTGAPLHQVAQAISTEWNQKHSLTITLGRQRCISIQGTVDLSACRYILPQNIRGAPSCGTGDNLHCGELKILHKKAFQYAGVMWVLIVTGYKSTAAFASKDLEIDVALKWCPSRSAAGMRRKLRLRYKLHIALAQNSKLAINSNGWATWSTGVVEIHEGSRVMLDSGDLCCMSELDPHYLRPPEAGQLQFVLDMDLVVPGVAREVATRPTKAAVTGGAITAAGDDKAAAPVAAAPAPAAPAPATSETGL